MKRASRLHNQPRSRKEALAQILRSNEPCGPNFSDRIIAKHGDDNLLWVVKETVFHKKASTNLTHWAERTKQGRRILLFELFEKASSTGFMGTVPGGWECHVSTEDNCHHYSCPLEFLDMVPCGNDVWREKVREHHRFCVADSSLPRGAP